MLTLDVTGTGEARLNVDGKLLGATQDASILLTDFPLSTLQPLFKSIPGLQNAAPALPAGKSVSPCCQQEYTACYHKLLAAVAG